MNPMHPHHFHKDYVSPSVRLWQNNQVIAHLAVHAITQLDVLAEVTAHWMRENGLRNQTPSAFRMEQRQHEPVLAVVRDVHDTHKHGKLRPSLHQFISQGQRPALVHDEAFICGETECGGHPTTFTDLTITFDDGSEVSVALIIVDAFLAWEREYKRLGIPPLPQPDPIEPPSA